MVTFIPSWQNAGTTTPGKDINHQSSIYLIEIDKTWDFLVEPPDFNHLNFSFLIQILEKTLLSFLDRFQIFIWYSFYQIEDFAMSSCGPIVL